MAEHRRTLTACLAAGGVALAGCSSVLGTTNEPAHFDSCLSGRWVSTQSRATLSVNGQTHTLSGGEGAVLEITTDGAFTEDDAHAAPLTAGGLSLTRAGTARGTVDSDGGSVTLRYDDTTTLSVTLSQDGQTLSTAQPPKSLTEQFTCDAGQRLVLSTSQSPTGGSSGSFTQKLVPARVVSPSPSGDTTSPTPAATSGT